MTWVLIIFVGTGLVASGEANAVTSVPGFAAQQECEAAAKAVRDEFSSSHKRVLAVCVPQTKAGK